MRELKFRAWDDKRKVMVYANEPNNTISIYLDGSMDSRFVGSVNGESWQTDERFFTIMQYTGLKDKTGKEIYEGDIVELTASDEETKYRKTVDFVWGAFCFCSGDVCYTIKDNERSECEVIGNIYETPEKLKEV